ncbi:MAG TPA: PDZ domain-containing protein [Thermoanaerobaculia bacterium]|nr:PDZ domain-containing protein [Thermoanaerobaculia bacterium]
MKISLSRTVLLSTLLLVPSASRVRADGDPPTPPTPPQAATAPEAPEAPVPPAPPARRKKRVIVTAPEKEIVVDGDRVFVWNGEDTPEAFADMDGMERMELDGPQTFLRHHGSMGGGFIGVRPIEMTPELRQHFGAPKDAGILVGSVEPDGPAARAGVKVGDIVTRVDGDRIDSVLGLVRTVRHKKEGEKVTVEVLRDRTAKSLTVVVVERKDREIRVGALEEGMPGMRWKSRGPHAFIAPPPSDMSGLEERLDEMDKRLRELEGRKPGQ